MQQNTQLNEYKYQKKIGKRYREFLKGKRVILVGPAAYLETMQMGPIIDSYDIVARVKKGFPVPERLINEYGAKTHVIYSNLKYATKKDTNGVQFYQNNFEPSHQSLMIDKGISYIVCPYPTDYRHFKDFMNQFCAVYRIADKIPVATWKNKYNKFNELRELLGGHDPTILMAALYDLIDSEATEIFITGFSFRTDGYYTEYKTASQDISTKNKTIGANKVHDMTREMDLFKAICQLDNRIRIDEYMASLINII